MGSYFFGDHQVLHFSVFAGGGFKYFPRAESIDLCHPHDLHIVLDDEGRNFLIFEVI